MRILLVLFSFFAVCRVFTQEPDFRNYAVEDGLPSSECYQILQDRQGYIWIATDKGVSRYDGYDFQNFTTENGLPENCVLRMYLDPKGRIWFACLSGKMAIYENGKLKPLPINKEILQKVKGGIINSMCMYRDTLHLGYTCSSKILQIVHKTAAFKLLNRQKHLREGAFIQTFRNNETCYGWVVDDRMKFKIERLDIFHNNKRIVVNNIFRKWSGYWFMAKRFQNKLYVISAQDLNVFSMKGEILKRKSFSSRLLALKLEDKKNSASLWIGTMRGLYYFKDHLKLIDPVIYLKGRSVTYFYRDREGGIWVATLDHGVYYAKNVRVQNFLTNQKVFSLLRHGNKLILGLDDSQIVVFDKNQSTKLRLPYENSGYPVKGIFSVGGDHILVRRDRVSVFSLKTMKILKKFERSAPNAVIHFPETKKALFFEQNSITEYDQYTVIAKWLSKEYEIRFQCAALLKNGRTLVGTNEGLAEYNKSTNELQVIDRSITDILHIAEYDQVIWLASKESGIGIKRKGKSYKISYKSGLTSNYCRHIYLEDASTAWISTNKGLTLVKVSSWFPFKYKCFQFSKKDGLICDELTAVCEWEGKIVVAGTKGLSMLDKSKMFMPEYKPKVYLSGLLINGKKLQIRDYYNLRNEIKNLVIDFRGLCFRNEGKLLYRYRFGGMESRWQTTSNTSVEYNKVPYGKMVFEVQAQSTDGNWNTPIRKVVLFSPTPFFETTWFIVLLIAGVGILVWSFLYWRIRLIQKRASDREQLYRKASEMELKFLTGQMNPHFTFNAMNSIQHFMLENDLLKAQNYLTKYSKLIRKVLENNMDEYVCLSAELDLLRLYIEIESMRFSKQVEFQIHCSPDLISDYKIPPMLIQPYIENAIWHGLFDDAVVNGSIRLTISEEDDALKCVIEDNGIGRKRAQLNQKQSGKSQSLGMLITRKRLDHLNDSNLVAPEIIDLYNEYGNPCGTKVVLYIPAIRK